MQEDLHLAQLTYGVRFLFRKAKTQTMSTMIKKLEDEDEIWYDAFEGNQFDLSASKPPAKEQSYAMHDLQIVNVTITEGEDHTTSGDVHEVLKGPIDTQNDSSKIQSGLFFKVYTCDVFFCSLSYQSKSKMKSCTYIFLLFS